MTTGKRIGLSFGCLIAGACVMPIVQLIIYPIKTLINPAYAVHSISTVILRSLWVIPLNLMFALGPWLLILPVVILLKDAEGWRGWLTAITGMIFGPLMMFLWPLALNGHFNKQGDAVGILMAAFVSIPTTLLYILALKRNTRTPAS